MAWVKQPRELSVSPEDLVAIEEIKSLKARYFRLLDQKRWDEWTDVFTEDVHIDTSHGGVGEMGIVDGRDNFRAFLEPMLDGVITTHHGHMPEINITDSASAEGTWAMEDHLDWGGDSTPMWGTGWYTEQYRKCDDGAWRISALTLTRNRVELGARTFPPATPAPGSTATDTGAS